MNRTHEDIIRWRTEALALSANELRTPAVPLHVVFGEAVDVAKFADDYWHEENDEGGNVVRAGLRSAVRKGGGALRLTSKTSSEILSLQRAAQEAHTRYLLAIDAKPDVDPVGRGRFLLAEISATLAWLFDDGIDDQKDAQLANVVLAHADDPATTDALASALDDYAGLAEPHAKEMHGLGGFDARFIAEARGLAGELRARPAQPVALSPAARGALTLLDGLVTLLLDRMGLVRAAARFVFRTDPEIARLATSAYERRRRAAARKGKPAPAPAPGGTAGNGGVGALGGAGDAALASSAGEAAK
jgi:hypothetical protein